MINLKPVCSMYWNRVLLIKLIISCSLFSCEDHESPIQTGNLIGSVRTFDEFGEELQDHSGVEVFIEGTDPVLKTLTDTSGNYSFEDLPIGTYNLIYTKEYFQTWKIFSYQFVGGSVPTYFNSNVSLSKVSTTTITQFSISITDENNPDSTKYTMVKVEYATQPVSTQEEPRNLKVFLSASSDVSIENYQYKLSLGTTGNLDIIRINKLPANAVFYAIMYPEPGFCNSYYDPFQNVRDYSCYGAPSNVVSFEVPSDD